MLDVAALDDGYEGTLDLGEGEGLPDLRGCRGRGRRTLAPLAVRLVVLVLLEDGLAFAGLGLLPTTILALAPADKRKHNLNVQG